MFRESAIISGLVNPKKIVNLRTDICLGSLCTRHPWHTHTAVDLGIMRSTLASLKSFQMIFNTVCIDCSYRIFNFVPLKPQRCLLRWMDKHFIWTSGSVSCYQRIRCCVLSLDLVPWAVIGISVVSINMVYVTASWHLSIASWHLYLLLLADTISGSER